MLSVNGQKYKIPHQLPNGTVYSGKTVKVNLFLNNTANQQFNVDWPSILPHKGPYAVTSTFQTSYLSLGIGHTSGSYTVSDIFNGVCNLNRFSDINNTEVQGLNPGSYGQWAFPHYYYRADDDGAALQASRCDPIDQSYYVITERPLRSNFTWSQLTSFNNQNILVDTAWWDDSSSLVQLCFTPLEPV